MKYLAFDIEIFKPIPKDAPDWKQHRPLGISCAATMASDEPRLWHNPTLERMTFYQVVSIIHYLERMVEQGYKILTWNGLGFDFDILTEESGVDCSHLAINHIDMMFHLFCLKGFPLGLRVAALGMGLPGKTEGMDGAQAPELWQNGEYEKVLEYVGQDVRTTLAVAQAVDAAGKINWTAKSGRANSVDIPRWLTCAEALELPLPDTSWMTDPWSRRKFIEWIPAQPLPDVEF